MPTLLQGDRHEPRCDCKQQPYQDKLPLPRVASHLTSGTRRSRGKLKVWPIDLLLSLSEALVSLFLPNIHGYARIASEKEFIKIVTDNILYVLFGKVFWYTIRKNFFWCKTQTWKLYRYQNVHVYLVFIHLIHSIISFISCWVTS